MGLTWAWKLLMKTPPHLASTFALATAKESSIHQGSAAAQRHVPPQCLGESVLSNGKGRCSSDSSNDLRSENKYGPCRAQPCLSTWGQCAEDCRHRSSVHLVPQTLSLAFFFFLRKQALCCHFMPIPIWTSAPSFRRNAVKMAVRQMFSPPHKPRHFLCALVSLTWAWLGAPGQASPYHFPQKRPSLSSQKNCLLEGHWEQTGMLSYRITYTFLTQNLQNCWI